MNMKKRYIKPEILVEVFTLQEALCSCAVENKLQAEHQQCAYELAGTGIFLFAGTWEHCTPDSQLWQEIYCYQPGVNNVFSS